MAGLAQRLATAAVLVPLVIGAVWLLPSAGFALVIAAFVLVAGWEWAGLAGFSGPLPRLALVLALAASLGATASLLATGWGGGLLLGAGVVWWSVALAWVVRYQQGRVPAALASRPLVALCGWLVLVPAWAALVELHTRGPGGRRWVLAVLVLVWLADSVAYFAGRLLGRRRLASRVSPGKSVEGVLAGLLAVVVVALAAAEPLGLAAERLGFALLCALVALVSVLGDLAESLFKRQAGVKDSGLIMPGHGGVLDRIDGLVAAAPFFALGAGALGGPG